MDIFIYSVLLVCTTICQTVSGSQNIKTFQVCFDVSNKEDLSFGMDGLMSCEKDHIIYVTKESYSLHEYQNKKCEAPSYDFCQYSTSGDTYNLGTGAVCNGLRFCTGDQMRSTLKLWTENFIFFDGRKDFKPCTAFSTKYITVSIEYVCIDESQLIDMCSDFEDQFSSLNYLWIRKSKLTSANCRCSVQGYNLTTRAMEVYSIEDGDTSITLSGRRKQCTVNEINMYNKKLSCSQTKVKAVNMSVRAILPHAKFWMRLESNGRQMIKCSASQLMEPINNVTRKMIAIDDITTTYLSVANTTSMQNNESKHLNITRQHKRWHITVGIASASTVGGIFISIIMVFAILVGCSHLCGCHHRYASLKVRRKENTYTDIRAPPDGGHEPVQMRQYENSTQSGSQRDTVHSYADILDPNDLLILELKNTKTEDKLPGKSKALYINA